MASHAFHNTGYHLRRWWRRQHAWCALALIGLASLAAYWPSFSSPFQFDDYNDIALPYFHLTPPRALVQRYPTRWIPYLTLLGNANLPRLQWRSWRAAEMVWYHGVNWLAHVGVAWMVYHLTRRLLRLLRHRRPAGVRALSARGAPLACSLAFALHPLFSQTVIYLSQRATLFMALCYLGMLGCVAAAVTPGRGRAWRWAGAGMWLALGIGCKETIVSAPAAAALLVWLFRPVRRAWHWQRALWWSLGLVLICAAPVLLFLHLSRWHVPTLLRNLRSVGGPLHAHTHGLTRATYAITQVTVIGRYLLLSVWPRGLSVDHDVPLMTAVWQTPVVCWGVVLLGLAWLAWHWRRRAPLVTWGYGFFLVALLPQSSIMPTPDLMLEYRVYPALAGVVWMAAGLYGMAASRLTGRRWQWLAGAALAAVLCMYGALTWQRGRIWRSDVTLWYDAWRKAPRKQRAANNLANALLRINQYDAARRVLEETIVTSTTVLPHVYATLGNIHAGSGAFDLATNCYLVSLKHDWSNRDVRFNLGLVYSRMGLRPQALEQLRWLAHVYPDYADGWLLLGVIASEDPGTFVTATNSLTRYLRLVPAGAGADTARATLEQLQRRD